jgi:branched-chain amino acid transport system substrate-binding protein
MQVAMLVPEAAAKLKKKRWAIVYPNYEYGQSAAATFKKLLKAAQPDVEFVAEQAPPLGKVDAGSVVQALADAKPDAIFNVLFAADLAQVRARGQHPRPVQGARGGEPADGRARVPGPAQGRGAGGLDRHRLPLVWHQDPEHQGVS